MEGRAMATRRGQAMMELAVGMLALALVASALFAFGDYIIASLDMHRHLRADAGKGALNGFGDGYSSKSDSDTVEVEKLASQYVFGSEEVEISESVSIPNMIIPKPE